MNYNLIKDVLDLIAEFDRFDGAESSYEKNVEGFKKWIAQSVKEDKIEEPDWEGKEKGRSPESVINTLIVHMNRYAKSYSKSAIHGSDFSTQEDFIYLINLKAFGKMTKMDLIKQNVHEKSVGMQIINRLIKQGWVDQTDSEVDRRSKLININKKGIETLEKQMDKVRSASKIVTGDLTDKEKMQLIVLLNKLNDFHLPIYNKNLDSSELLDEVMKEENQE